MRQTNLQTLPRLTRQSPRPRRGIVHIGLTSYFRAVHADYTEDALRARGGAWGTVVVTRSRFAMAQQLKAQGGAFTAFKNSEDYVAHRVQQSLVDVICLRDSSAEVIATMSDPAIRLVSLSIEAAGYCLVPATRALDLEHPDVLHDLDNPFQPRSDPGIIVEALRRRRVAGHRPFTVMSLDPLVCNGHFVRDLVTQLAQATDPELARWIEAEVAFPSSVSNRLVAPHSHDDIERVAEMSGYRDPTAIRHELFRDWVIEDTFVDGNRPAWHAAGARFVPSVEPHARAKLRIIDGSCLLLAALGRYSNEAGIPQMLDNPLFRRYLTTLWEKEIIPGVRSPDIDFFGAFPDASLERLSSKSLPQPLPRILMNGSYKIAAWIFGAIEENIAAGRDISLLCLGVAAWLRLFGAEDDNGTPIFAKDPLFGPIRAICTSALSPPGRIDSLLGIRRLFPDGLARSQDFRTQLLEADKALAGQGIRGALTSYFLD